MNNKVTLYTVSRVQAGDKVMLLETVDEAGAYAFQEKAKEAIYMLRISSWGIVVDKRAIQGSACPCSERKY